jgi:hypothetical protein
MVSGQLHASLEVFNIMNYYFLDENNMTLQ